MYIEIEEDMYKLLNMYAGFADQTPEQLVNILLASALQVLTDCIRKDKDCRLE